MTKNEAFGLIEKVYSHNEHRSSDKPRSISATTLIGSLYKGKLAINSTEQDNDLVSYKQKRGSAIGTAFHEYAAKVLDKDCVNELYQERNICDYVISGSCDILYPDVDNTWTILDWKTGIGKQRQGSNLDKDRLQMSIYRWLNQDEYEIQDTAYSLFVSTSNNEEEAYEIHLMSLEETEEYITDKLSAIEETIRPDCKQGIRYDPCLYCNYVCNYRGEI